MLLRTSPSPRTTEPVPHGPLVDSHALSSPGLPVLRGASLYKHAAALTPVRLLRFFALIVILSTPAAFPVPLSGRLSHRPFRGLFGVHLRCGLLVRGVAQGDPFHRRLRQVRCLPCRSDCYRLERTLAGWELHPLKTHAFHGAQRDRSNIFIFFTSLAAPTIGWNRTARTRTSTTAKGTAFGRRRFPREITSRRRSTR
jgi:hypothetical protein